MRRFPHRHGFESHAFIETETRHTEHGNMERSWVKVISGLNPISMRMISLIGVARAYRPCMVFIVSLSQAIIANPLGASVLLSLVQR